MDKGSKLSLSVGRVLGSGIFIVAGVVIFYIFLPGMLIRLESTSYPTTDGTILGSYIATDIHTDGSTLYRAVITFQYTVDGTSYQSSAIKVGQDNDVYTSDYDGILTAVNNYPVGKNVTVYFNPDEPSIAGLEAGVDEITYIFIGAGAIFFLIGSVFWINRFRKLL